MEKEIRNATFAEGGVQKEFYPVTHEDAVVTKDGKKLGAKLEEALKKVGFREPTESVVVPTSMITDYVGALDDLQTEDKSNIVNAINEVNAKGGGGGITDFEAANFAASDKVIFKNTDGSLEYLTETFDSTFKTKHPDIAELYSVGETASSPFQALQNTGVRKVYLRFGNLKKSTNSTNWGYGFCYNCKSLEYFDARWCYTGRFDGTFTNCDKLVYCGLPLIGKNTYQISTTFIKCTSLTNIECSGEICCSLNLSASPITRQSFINIANAVTNWNEWTDEDKIAYAPDGLTLTLSAYTKALLNDDDRAIIINKGWTIA